VEPSYELLVRYLTGVDPLQVVHALLTEWRGSGRPKLLYFPKSGEGSEPTEELLTRTLGFSKDREDVALRLRTTRARKPVDVADVYFTSPAWNYSKPANYVSVTFTHDMVDTARAGYTCKVLGELLGSLVTAGPAESGYVEAYSALHSPRMEQANRLTKGGPGGHLLHWITYLPTEVRKQIQGPGHALPPELHMLHEMENGGAIVATREEPPVNRAAHVERLVALAESLGLVSAG
jgi:hypothetical protein